MSEHSLSHSCASFAPTVDGGRVAAFVQATAANKPKFTWWGERRPSD